MYGRLLDCRYRRAISVTRRPLACDRPRALFIWMSTSLARLGLLLALAAPLAAQTVKRPLRSDDIYRLRDVRDPQRSPDGKWVAYTVSTVDTARDRNSSDIWLVSWSGGDEKQITNTPESESSPRWSPDGKWLSFLSSRQGGDGAQLWLVNPAGGEAERVTKVSGGISDYAWSPDSKRLVFVVSDTAATPPKSGTKPPVVIDRYHFKSDPGGYLVSGHDHLALFDLDARTLSPLTSGDFDDSDPAWSPRRRAHRVREQARLGRSRSQRERRYLRHRCEGWCGAQATHLVRGRRRRPDSLEPRRIAHRLSNGHWREGLLLPHVEARGHAEHGRRADNSLGGARPPGH
jgi:hypothetical protein